MKYIQKGSEPLSLSNHRNWIASDPERALSKKVFETYQEKHELRDYLLREQGFVCCYCMRQINNEFDERGKSLVRIEHWAPQSIYDGTNDKPDLRLEYGNLLAACNGNERGPKHLYCCDKSKGNIEITINPTQPICESQFYFSSSGEITECIPVLQ